jgi:hypothetical protein
MTQQGVPRMFHRIHTVKPLQDLNLLVFFTNNEVKQYDVRPLLSEWEPFRLLDTIPGLFDNVYVDTGGYGVVWNDEIDLSCNELYNNGIPV